MGKEVRAEVVFDGVHHPGAGLLLPLPLEEAVGLRVHRIRLDHLPHVCDAVAAEGRARQHARAPAGLVGREEGESVAVFAPRLPGLLDVRPVGFRHGDGVGHLDEHGTASQLTRQAEEVQAAATPTQREKTRAGGPKTKEQKRREAEARNHAYRALQNDEAADYSLLTSFQLQKLYEQTEAAILEKEERQAALETALGDPTLYQDPARTREMTAAYEAIQEELAALYERWETLAEHLMA